MAEIYINQNSRLKDGCRSGKKDLEVLIDDLNEDMFEMQLDINENNGIKTAEIRNKLRIMSEVRKLVTDNGRLELWWQVEKGILQSRPIDIYNLECGNFSLLRYFNYEDKQLIKIEYPEMLDLIALELSYRDLGETKESIEYLFRSKKIIGSSFCRDIYEQIQNTYKDCKHTRIYDSPYIIHEDRQIADYFKVDVSNLGSTYQNVVRKSCRRAMSLIAESIQKEINTANKSEYNLISVADEYLLFSVRKSEVGDIERDLNINIFVRAFGRKIELSMKTISVIK